MIRALTIIAGGALIAIALAAPASAWETHASAGGGFEAKVSAAAAVKGADGAEAKPQLTVSCEGKGLFVTVSWPDTVPLNANQHFASVSWSLDGKAGGAAMIASSGSVSLAGSEAKEWLREMAGAARLEVRVPDAHGGQSASFDLAGVQAVQAGLAGTPCG